MIDTFTHKCYYWMTTGRGYYVHDFLGLHFSLEVYDTFYLIISNHLRYLSVASSKLRIFFIYGKIYLQPRNATRALKIRTILFYNLIHLKHKALLVPSISKISQANLWICYTIWNLQLPWISGNGTIIRINYANQNVEHRKHTTLSKYLLISENRRLNTIQYMT